MHAPRRLLALTALFWLICACLAVAALRCMLTLFALQASLIESRLGGFNDATKICSRFIGGSNCSIVSRLVQSAAVSSTDASLVIRSELSGHFHGCCSSSRSCPLSSSGSSDSKSDRISDTGATLPWSSLPALRQSPGLFEPSYRCRTAKAIDVNEPKLRRRDQRKPVT
jgi:hypothetical protein